ncbi:membrane protein insertase YidC [Sphingomonas sp. MAH-20]|uniref:Membrane protein insertase YidC n=1 Tax=Sphingomonas horti TaxID=2682842 RepID=A0A6I4IYJ8_9SPHN|nr:MULTISPECIES: membrane protein insertase YidC [Sphingomonas]MBA2918258.1 membrane protein insertase YidC [Sphingomonas sp. CGMCC 1.13658]MVO77225.1 membrane protein insertase YidC [Sphingomonas horti]
MENQRNMILAIVLSAIVLFGWSALSNRIFPTANPPATKVINGKQVPVPSPTVAPTVATPKAVRSRDVVLRETPRVRVDTPSVAGSISLVGARVDDLVLKRHRETIAKNSPPVRLLSPEGAPGAIYAQFGWSGQGMALPGNDTVWQADGQLLAPGKPVTLSWSNGTGQTFRIKLAIDENYMITAEQSVANGGAGPVAVRPFALVKRTGVSADPSSWTQHTGPIGVFDGTANYKIDFKDLDSAGAQGESFTSTGGWLGFTDKYWLTAIAPAPNTRMDASFRAIGDKLYLAAMTPAGQTVVAPGKAVSTSTYLFSGAKEVSVLQHYENDLNITGFDKAIDWGWFSFFERPIFWLLDNLFKAVGNFGVAIILLTLIVRGLMFPIAQRQFASMAAMRALQPKVKALQERHKDDKPKLQQEMLELYKREKVNPLAGCLPIVLQIPVFYALYKVLMLTIEMRHQPFVLWIKDLSAPDPLTPVNLFGYLDFTPPHMLALGVLPILLGITMYIQFKLNPAQMDPVQQQVFSIMPWVFMFIMAPFAAGLQLYWTVSNLLAIAQQKWLYSRYPALKNNPNTATT